MSVLLIALLWAQDRPPKPLAAELTFESRETASATIDRVADGVLEYSREGKSERVPLERVLSVVLKDPAAAPPEPPDRVCVARVGPLKGTITALDGKRVKLRTTFAGEIEIQLARVNDLVFDGPHYGNPHGARTVVVTRTGKTQPATDVVFTEGGIRADGAEFKREELSRISFPTPPAPKEKPAEGWYARIETTGGERLAGSLVELGPSGATFFSPALGTLSIAAADLRRIDFSSHPPFSFSLILLSEDDGMRLYNAAGGLLWEWPGGNPCDAIVTPDGNLMFRHHDQREVITATFGRNEISKITTNETIEDFTRLPDGRVAACQKGGVTIYDAEGKEERTISSDGTATSVAPLPGGDLVISDSTGTRNDASGHRWEDDRMKSIYDLAVLPSGHLLFAVGNQVVEFDDDGQDVWEMGDLSDPSDAWRLPDGDTLIIENGANRLIEVAPGKKTLGVLGRDKRIVDMFVIE